MVALEDRFSRAKEVTGAWWIFLIAGVLWLLLALIVLRFDASAVATVGTLIAIAAILAGVNEFATLRFVGAGWKVIQIILGVVFVVAGVVAFAYPGATFFVMASIVGFLLVLNGAFDLVTSFVIDTAHHFRWLQLIIGVAEIVLGFWASAYLGRQAVLLLVFVGAWCLARGMTEIGLAFQIRVLHKSLA